VVRVPGCRSRSPVFDSRHYQIFWEVSMLMSAWNIVQLQERPKCTVSKDCLIRYRNSCSQDEGDPEGSSGAWHRDEDPTEDKITECEPSSIKVGYLYCYLLLLGIISGYIELCWDFEGKGNEHGCCKDDLLVVKWDRGRVSHSEQYIIFWNYIGRSWRRFSEKICYMSINALNIALGVHDIIQFLE
jgi:hypothetical protein